MSNPKRARSPYELTLATWQDPIKDANFAFDGAVFHFRELEELVRGGKAHREDSARLHWHFRSFFWELFTARDCLLKSGDASYIAHAKRLSGVQWFEQVSVYRNHLHRSTYVIEAFVSNGVMIAMQLQPLSRAVANGDHGPAGDALVLLNWYLSNMRSFLDDAPSVDRP